MKIKTATGNSSSRWKTKMKPRDEEHEFHILENVLANSGINGQSETANKALGQQLVDFATNCESRHLFRTQAAWLICTFAPKLSLLNQDVPAKRLAHAV